MYLQSESKVLRTNKTSDVILVFHGLSAVLPKAHVEL
jgi:hypothetical protein